MTTLPHVLIVECSCTLDDDKAQALEHAGFELRRCSGLTEFAITFYPDETDCVLCCLQNDEDLMHAILKEVSGRQCQTPILFIARDVSVSAAIHAIEAGAFGIFDCEPDTNEFLDKVHRAIDFDKQVKQNQERQDKAQRRLGILTQREREVMDLMLMGLTSGEIGDQLTVSARTVDVHLAHIRSKLGVSTNFELISLAVQAGQLEFPAFAIAA